MTSTNEIHVMTGRQMRRGMLGIAKEETPLLFFKKRKEKAK